MVDPTSIQEFIDALNTVNDLDVDIKVQDQQGNKVDLDALLEDVDQDGTDESQLYTLTGPVSVISEGLDLTSAQEVVLPLSGRSRIALFAKADTATTFHLDASYDNSTFITDVNPGPDAGSYSNSTSVRFEGFASFQYFRLRSDAAGSSGDTVDLILQAPGSG